MTRFAAAGFAIVIALGVPLPVYAQGYPAKTVRFVVPYAEGGASGLVSRRPVRGQDAQAAGFHQVALVTALSYPTRPVRFVVPYAPGGTTDILSRLISQKMSERWGQQVIVDNRAGAGGAIGAELAARAAPDGYTIMIGGVANMALSPGLIPQLKYDPNKDFEPITLIATVPIMIASHPSLPVRRVADLISLAKRNPGQINFGSSGTGGLPHLSGELFKRLAGVDIVHVPYKGSAQAVTDTMAGQVQVIFDLMPSTLPHVKQGRLRGIAVCSKTRSNAAPDIPTVIESGLPNYEVASWFGILAPARTPREIIAQLHTEINRIIFLPDMRQQFAVQGADPVGSTPEQLRQLIREDITRWSEVIRIAGARIE